MKINLGNILKTLYALVLKGKTVSVGGVKVTLPEEGNTIPTEDNKTLKK